MNRSRLIPAIVIGVVALLLLSFSPLGKPPDRVQTLYLLPRFGVKRELIGSASNGKGLLHLPRSITLSSNGPVFRAYLLDLTRIPDTGEQVRVFMAASEAIERGVEPATGSVARVAVGVSHAEFKLHRWPWGPHADYMLIVASGVESQVLVRVSYGG